MFPENVRNRKLGEILVFHALIALTLHEDDQRERGTFLAILIHITVKACVRFFLTNFYFSPNDSPSKTMKDFFISFK